MWKAMPGVRPLLVCLPIKVNTYDIDVARHVNNGVYIRWLEDLRMEFLRVNYPLERLLDEDIVPIIHSTHIVYRKSIQLFDDPVGLMWCSKIGRATLTVDAEFLVKDTLCAEASQRGILLKLGTTRPSRTPPALLEKFAKENRVPRLPAPKTGKTHPAASPKSHGRT